MITRNVSQPLACARIFGDDFGIIFNLGIYQAGIDVLMGKSVFQVFQLVAFQVNTGDAIQLITYPDDEAVGQGLFEFFNEQVLVRGILSVVNVGETKKGKMFGSGF